MNKTFVRPLTFGRMGNFLFQAACAMAYAWRHRLEFSLPNTTNDAFGNPIYLQHLCQPEFNDNLPHVVVTEGKFTYQTLPFKEEWRHKNIILDGYWQTEKYFKEYRDRIITAFGYEWKPAPQLVSVHVRRGDYLTIKKNGKFKHPPVPKEWLETAMALFPGYGFRFFSDDIGWCEQEFGSRNDCTFSKDKPIERDLVHMSWCAHQICSASTFSWWGAWLNQNPNKRVIMPKHWFSPGWGRLDTSDIVPPEWERI